MNRGAIIAVGALATFGAFMGVWADFFSAWSPNSSEMETAFSVDLDSVRGFYEGKPRWTYVLGNYLGVYFIPLHTFGFFLVYQALKPANAKWALVFLALAVYIMPIGVGMHGTLAFVGDIIQSGDPDLINGIRDYWQPWAYSLVIVYGVISVLILALIVTGRSLYPRWAALVSPMAVLVVTSVITAILPDSAAGLKSFLSLTGLNLPMMIFYPVTTWVLARNKDISIPL